MRRHIVYSLGLALTLAGVGAWAIDAQNAGNGAGAGTELQTPAPANPNAPAPPNQAQPNPAPPAPAPANPAPPNPAPPAPAPPDQTQPAPAAPNPAPPNAEPANPAPPAPAPPAPAPSTAAGQTGTAAAPTYFSPLQELASHQVDEIGALEQQLDQFRAAHRPDAVMVTYHMIRDHRLIADAASNMLARRGEVAAPTITAAPSTASTPADMIRQDVQDHQQAAANLQQLVSSANTPEDKNLYQQALNVANKHLQWLQALDQGQPVQVGFFDPTTPLGQLAGAAPAGTAVAGYPQPPIAQRVAGYQQQIATRRVTTRHRRYHRYRRTVHSRRRSR